MMKQDTVAVVTSERYALLTWDKAGAPSSRHFGDVYFSRDDGLAESRFIFIGHNQLARRFAAPAPLFTIGEIGFGSGLNFLAAVECFQQHAPSGSRLVYHSAERYPLRPADLHKTLALWPELAALAAPLCAVYAPYQHTVYHPFSGVELHLHIGDARQVVADFPLAVDAWFLDGFSPAKNPELWGTDLLQTVAAHTAPNGTFATFTAAGRVKRALSAAGFTVEKVPGHGRKREMLTGCRAIR